MLVIDNDMLPNTGACILKRFLISNWSNGLITLKKKFIIEVKTLHTLKKGQTHELL